MTPHEIPKVELRRGDIVQVTPSACECLPALRRPSHELNPPLLADGVKFINHFFWQ